MTHRGFGGMVDSKTVCFSGGQICIVVETLDNSAGTLSFGSGPVERYLPHPGN
jgi:hypothetical protein